MKFKAIFLIAVFSCFAIGKSLAYGRLDWQAQMDEQKRLSAQGQFIRAIEVGNRAVAIAKVIFGENHLDTAISLNNIAINYIEVGEYSKAMLLQIRVNKIFKENLDSEHPDIATGLNNLALTYLHLSQYQKALPLLVRALAITEKTQGLDHPDTAIRLNNLASAYVGLAQYDKALPLQLRSLEIRRKNEITEQIGTANTLNNLARTFHAMAQFNKALDADRLALEIVEKIMGANHPRTAKGLNHLAFTYRAIGQYDNSLNPEERDHAFANALSLELRALAIRESTLGENNDDTAQSLENLAETYRSLNQNDLALPLQLRALKIKENALGPNHSRTATSKNNLATTYFHLGQYEKASILLWSSLSNLEKTLGSNHPDTARILSNLAYVLKNNGDSSAAILIYKRSINALQFQRQIFSRIGAIELKSYSASVQHVYTNLASLLTDQGRLSEAQQVLDMLKEDEQFEYVRRSVSKENRKTKVNYNRAEKKWMVRYQVIADKLAILGVKEATLQKAMKFGLSQDQKYQQDLLNKDLEKAQKSFQLLLIEMREGFTANGPGLVVEEIETSNMVVRETQSLLRKLGNGTILLRYFVADEKVGMILTTENVQRSYSTPIKSIDLNRKIAEFKIQLRESKSDVKPLSQELYQILVTPLEEDLKQSGAAAIMLSLDGALRYLPFGALHDGKQYLVERWNLPIYTSITKDKLRDAVTRQWRAAGLGLTRAMGEFEALPSVKTEMGSIVKVGSTGVLPGEVYLDEAFSAVRLKDVSQRKFQVLHVASHFRFSPGTEVNSFLLLGDGQQLTLGDIRTQNYRFDNVDLLTLSACDTGLGGGRDAQGKEIEGFGVVAQQQGAKAVLATLWSVADQSTAVLMAEMYKRRQEQGLTKIEALRQAQLSLLSQPRYAHPFYWAPFILMGNWK